MSSKRNNIKKKLLNRAIGFKSNSAGNGKMRTVSPNTRSRILKDLAFENEDKYTLAIRYNISVSEIKRIQKTYKNEINKLKENQKNENASTTIGAIIGDQLNGIEFPEEVEIEETEQAKEIVKMEIEHVEPEQERLFPEKEIEDSMVKEMHRKKNNRKVDDETVQQILNDLKLQCYTQRHVAEKFNVSPSLVGMINRGEGRFSNFKPTNIKSSADDNSSVENLDDLLVIPTLPVSDEKANELDEKSLKIIANESILSNRKKVIGNIKIGMIRGRHTMPVNTFIYDYIDSDMISNFDKQYDVAYSRIQEILSKNDNTSSDKRLVVYVTGLCSVLASIIKVCLDLKINLRLMHWNPNKYMYSPQDVFNQFADTESNICPTELDNLSCRHLYTFRCLAKDFVRKGFGYELIEYISQDGRTVRSKDITLFLNQDDAWSYYQAACENAPSNSNLILNKVNLVDNILIIQKTVSKMINYSYSVIDNS